MATCKNCFHHDICEEHKRLMLTAIDICELVYQNGVEKSCHHFKDTKKILELPCVVKDTAYMVTNGGFIRNLKVTSIDIKLRETATDFDCWAVYDLDGCPCHIAIVSDKVGEVYFFNPDDAQKALKERFG